MVPQRLRLEVVERKRTYYVLGPSLKCFPCPWGFTLTHGSSPIALLLFTAGRTETRNQSQQPWACSFASLVLESVGTQPSLCPRPPNLEHILDGKLVTQSQKQGAGVWEEKESLSRGHTASGTRQVPRATLEARDPAAPPANQQKLLCKAGSHALNSRQKCHFLSLSL